jgi:hypothetical protein
MPCPGRRDLPRAWADLPDLARAFVAAAPAHATLAPFEELRFEGRTLAGDRRMLAGDRRVLAGDRRTLAADRRVLAGDRRTLADDGRVLATDWWVLASDRWVLAGDRRVLAGAGAACRIGATCAGKVRAGGISWPLHDPDFARR